MLLAMVALAGSERAALTGGTEGGACAVAEGDYWVGR